LKFQPPALLVSADTSGIVIVFVAASQVIDALRFFGSTFGRAPPAGVVGAGDAVCVVDICMPAWEESVVMLLVLLMALPLVSVAALLPPFEHPTAETTSAVMARLWRRKADGCMVDALS
jgi:hypothetical protein